MGEICQPMTSGRNLRGGQMDFGLGETLFSVRLKKGRAISDHRGLDSYIINLRFSF